MEWLPRLEDFASYINALTCSNSCAAQNDASWQINSLPCDPPEPRIRAKYILIITVRRPMIATRKVTIMIRFLKAPNDSVGSGFVVDGYARAIAGIKADVRKEMDRKYSQELAT